VSIPLISPRLKGPDLWHDKDQDQTDQELTDLEYVIIPCFSCRDTA